MIDLDLELDEDERLLQASIRGALAAAAPHRALTHGGTHGDLSSVTERMWRLACDLGWLGACLPERLGGMGLSLRALAVLQEELGRGLFCGPFLANAVLPAMLLEIDPQFLGPFLPGIMDGTVRLAIAYPGDGGGDMRISPTSIEGRVDIVEHAGFATHMLALAVAPEREGGLALSAAIVPAAGIGVAARQPFDVTCPIATVQFAHAPVAARLHARLAPGERERLMRPVHLAIAAELIGIAQAAIERTIAHVTHRRQFGAPIGSFQAVKHRLADAHTLVGSARLAVRHAATDPDPSNVAMARVLAGDAALRAAGDGIQLQGGLGFSWESDAHLYLKRARRLVAAFGEPDQFRRRVADRFIAAALEASA